MVILGGNSNERKVSLDSGESCILALNKMGYNTIKFDPQKKSLHNIGNVMIVFSVAFEFNLIL